MAKKIKSYIEAPRWARIDLAIKNISWVLGLECEVERETSMLEETVRFKVEGDDIQVEKFKRKLRESINKFNEGDI